MSARRESSLVIETPEGVIFSYQFATPAARGVAWAVDMAAIAAASYFLSSAARTLGFLSEDLARALGVALYFFISVVYGIVLEWRWRGQTVGKRLLRLRVIDAGGLRLTFPQIALRNLLRAIDALPVFYLAGAAAAFLSRNGQRLGDLAANTVVVIEPARAEPDLELIAPAKYNSLLGYTHLAARLRSRAQPEAVGIAMRALVRRDAFEPAARVELFRQLADYFRGLVPFPEIAVEGLTDEQYVRSAVRVICQPPVPAVNPSKRQA
jgi:uncharacterized RDD family membrane protein YckC